MRPIIAYGHLTALARAFKSCCPLERDQGVSRTRAQDSIYVADVEASLLQNRLRLSRALFRVRFTLALARWFWPGWFCCCYQSSARPRGQIVSVR
jgi:hypothetical protein